MLTCLIPLLLLTLSAISVSVLLRKPFADTLAPVVFCVMLVLYSFYIFDLLPLGRILVTIFLVLGILCPLVMGRVKKETLLPIVTARSFLLYLAGAAVCFLFACNKFVNLWDCLRLWGAYPKALHTTGTLQLGEDALLFDLMQSYPPGMPLLGYYFSSFSPEFSESSLFFTYSYFGLALMLPFLKPVDRSSRRSGIWALLAILFIPYFITGMNGDNGYYYSSLFIDIPLGICCGYFFSRAFHPSGRWDALLAALSCGVLVLLKDSGAFFALCGIVGGLLCFFFDKKFDKSRILLTIAQMLMLAFTYGSWKYLTGLYTVENHIQVQFSMPSVLTLARLFFHLLRTPVTALFTVTGAVHVSLPAALLILFCAKLMLARNNPGICLRSERVEVLIQFIACVCFFAGYCFSFMNEIVIQEYPSYTRYFCTLVICVLYGVCYDACFRYCDYVNQIKLEISALIHSGTPLGSFLSLSKKILIFGLVLAMVFSTGLILLDFPSRQSDFCVRADASAAAVAKTAVEGDLFLCIPGDSGSNSRLHHRIYFELLDDGVRVRNFYPEADITHESYGYTSQSFLQHLIGEDYEYIMLTGVDEEILALFGDLFPDATLEDTDLIYQVTADGLIRIR